MLVEDRRVLLSIIIPIYNSEKQIGELLESIVCSKDKRIEIIIVDDGSTDSSLSVCQEYANKDSRIIVLHKENGGVSSARNTGIEQASGEYVFFCDSDDRVMNGVLEKGIACIDSASPDLLLFDFEYYSLDSDIRSRGSFALTPKRILDQDYIIENIMTPLVMRTNTGMASLWHKFFKRSIIMENSIRFEEQVYKGEDWRFILDFLSVAETAYYIPDVLYEYRLDGSQKEGKYKRIPGIHLLGAWKRKIDLNDKYSLGATYKTITGWYISLIYEVVSSARNECPLDELQKIMFDETVKRASREIMRIKGRDLLQMEFSRKIKLYAILIRYHMTHLLRFVARRLD